MKKRYDEALRQAIAKRYWSEPDARRVLAACTESGLSDAEYARREGVRASRLQWWRRQPEDTGALPVATALPRFMPVRLVRTSPGDEASARMAGPVVGGVEQRRAASPDAVEVVLLSGRRLRVGADLDAATVEGSSSSRARRC